MSGQLLNVIESIKEQVKDALWALSSCACQQNASVKINGRSYKIVKVLGEGGFSFVYLAQDEASGRQFALKKIRCPTGAEGVREVMREVEAYRRFRHPNIIRIFDSAVVQDRDGEGKIVYLFLPLYSRGNLQDAINSHSLNGSRFSESEMLKLFKGTCEAVRAMHDFRAPIKSAADLAKESRANGSARSQPRMTSSLPQPVHHGDDDDDYVDQGFPQPEGDEEGGFSYGGGGGGGSSSSSNKRSGQSIPLMSRDQEEHEEHELDNHVVFDGDQELADQQGHSNTSAPTGEMELVPYCHRDLKPANIMIADDGVTPILMDFGSTVKARIKVETRTQALVQQDLAAEQSSMPYRAPELFDVQTGIMLDEKVDIWSLGCVLFALAYSHSPFETPQTTDQGGSIAMAVLNAAYKHPSSSVYSEGFRQLIDSMLVPDPKERPDIHEVIRRTEALLRNLD